MAAPGYLARLSGFIKEVLAIQSSAGVADAAKVIATDATGRLDSSFLPLGVGADIQTILTSEDLAAQDLVNIWNDSGTIKCRKADADSAAKRAHGFVKAATTSGQNADIYAGGEITGLTSKTPGATQWLSKTAG